jgi:hypothetical protein
MHNAEKRAVWGHRRRVTQNIQPKQPRGQPRPLSRSTSLPFSALRDLLNAWLFAETTLPPDTLWAHAVVVLEQSADFDADDPRAYLALQGRILKHIREFLLRRGLPAHYLWVREIGPKFGRPHTHILLPLPPELRNDLEALIRRVGKLHDLDHNDAVLIRTNWSRGINTSASRLGVLRDWLKTASPKARFGRVPIMRALDIRHRAPCVIRGKRSGASQSLGRAARERAGWRERRTLSDLSNAIACVEEAGKQRQREKRRERQRRYRERKKAGIGWSPDSLQALCRCRPVLRERPRRRLP